MNRKEESIYIGEPMSDKEFEAYMERMDDPNDLSDERWLHIFCEWLNHCMDINWDGSYYDSILIQMKEGHESEIKGFIDRRIVGGRNLTHDMKTWMVVTKENHKDLFIEPEDEKEENVKLRFSKEQYFEFLKKVESDNYTPNNYTKEEKLISTGKSIREFKRQYIRKWRFDDSVPEACEMLTDEKNMQENELLEILKPPSKYYAQALLERVIYHFTNPNGDYFRKTHQLKVREGAKNIQIFVVDRKD